MPGEKAFLNALTDAVDDQPNVALVLVMIRSDEDEAGYRKGQRPARLPPTPRLRRNGETAASPNRRTSRRSSGVAFSTGRISAKPQKAIGNARCKKAA